MNNFSSAKSYCILGLIFFGIFFGSWFLLYKFGLNSLPMQSEDVVASVFTGIAIVEEGTLNLNNYYEMMISKYPEPDDRTRTPYYLIKVGDNYLTAFPIIGPLVTLPIFYIYSFFVEVYTWEDIYLLSHLTGSLVMALSGLLMFYLLREILKYNFKISLILTSTYLFATINLPLISQALWQHGVVQLFLILSVIFYLKKDYFWTYFFLGFAILSRPTALLVLAIISLFILWELYEKQKHLNFKTITTTFSKFVIKAILGILIPVILFLFYNSTFYIDISNQGYSAQLTNSWLGRFPESFIGMWLSPSKGLLIYSPFILFVLIAIYTFFKKDKLVQICFWVILLHTLVLSFWKHWYGGYGFGYRMASDILPFFILPLGYLWQEKMAKYLKPFFLTILISMIIQVSGLIFFDSIWHNAYDKGFRDTSWLWSVENSEAVFNLRRVMVKVGLLEKACEVCLPNHP